MIPLAKPWLSEEDARAAYDAVMSGWIMQGPRVERFEQAFREQTGAAHACAVSSGTAALVLALMAVGVKPGDVVYTASHSYIATANAIRACGAEPVFIDIETGGYNIDATALQASLEQDCEAEPDGLHFRYIGRLLQLRESPLHRIAPPRGRVAAILAVHQVGLPCNLDALSVLAKCHGLPLIEDAACAIGSVYQGQRIGAPHSDAACFSFHPRKIITTGDGGMITTSNPEIDRKVRLLRQHGMLPAPTGSFFESYLATAYNYRLTDLQAAIGLTQLGKLDKIVRMRRERVAFYRAVLGDHPRFRIPVEDEGSFSNWQSLPVEFDGDGVNQVALLSHLESAGVGAKPGIMNAHEETPYRGLWQLPNSEKKRRSTVLIPIYHSLTDDDARAVVAALKSFPGET